MSQPDSSVASWQLQEILMNFTLHQAGTVIRIIPASIGLQSLPGDPISAAKSMTRPSENMYYDQAKTCTSGKE